MRTAVFSTRAYDRSSLTEASAHAHHDLAFLEVSLSAATAPLARGFPAAALFVNDRADAGVLRALHASGTRFLALRSAGFNHVDLAEAERLGIAVARVPAYSPHAVAEHTIALILTLNRKTHRAYNRVREQNFSLDGLMGFDLFGKTAGVIGTGEIGSIVVRILRGFGCRVLVSDPVVNPACIADGAEPVPLDALLAQSDIVSLHCPLTPATRHLIDDAALAKMRPGAMLVNTSRGAVIDTRAIIGALKSGRIGSLAIDVYEEEADLFFRDLSETVIADDVFARLLTFPNVLITAHQAFFTKEAVRAIAETTIANLTGFDTGAIPPANLVSAAKIAR
jgi:D-lactate dehydrogenase